MDALDAATLLNRREYGSEVTAAESRLFRDNGLVVVFGASDGLIEFRGAIDDELGAYGGTAVPLTDSGLLVECDCECPHYRKAKDRAVHLRAIWDDGSGWSWKYQAPFPHVQFDILEDGEPYCRGIVFKLADVASAGEAGTAETTEIGSVHEHATAEGGDAQ